MAVTTGFTPATEQEYVSNGGTKCPFCGSELVNESIDDGAGTLTTRNDCDSCGKEWWAYYELFGIGPIEEDEEDE